MNNSFVIVMRFLYFSFAHGTSGMLAGLVIICQYVKSQTQKLITVLIVQMNKSTRHNSTSLACWRLIGGFAADMFEPNGRTKKLALASRVGWLVHGVKDHALVTLMDHNLRRRN